MKRRIAPAISGATETTLSCAQALSTACNKSGLKARQPLREMRVVADEKSLSGQMQPFLSLVTDELNIKHVSFVDSAAGLYNLSARLDAKTGKPKYGRLFGALQAALLQKPVGEIEAQLKRGETIALEVTDQVVNLPAEETVLGKSAEQGWEISEGRGFLVAIQTELDSDLIREGMVRDLVRHIQSLRKKMDLNVTDRIRVAYFANDDLAAAISAHGDYIAGETLVLEIGRSLGPPDSSHTLQLGGEAIRLSINKV